MKKTVIITGSSRGIGAETAIEFARNGYENIERIQPKCSGLFD